MKAEKQIRRAVIKLSRNPEWGNYKALKSACMFHNKRVCAEREFGTGLECCHCPLVKETLVFTLDATNIICWPCTIFSQPFQFYGLGKRKQRLAEAKFWETHASELILSLHKFLAWMEERHERTIS